MGISIEDSIKAAKEREAAAKDPATRADAKQVASTAATGETQQVLDAMEATQIGAPTAAKIMDSAQDLRPAGTVPNLAAQALALEQPVTREQIAATPMRTFRHVYAGATTIMPNGKNLRFGGGIGGPGFYATSKQEEIDFLSELAQSHGSQVSEPGRADHLDEFASDMAAATEVARANTSRFQDPKALKAFENLGNQIAHNG